MDTVYRPLSYPLRSLMKVQLIEIKVGHNFEYLSAARFSIPSKSIYKRKYLCNYFEEKNQVNIYNNVTFPKLYYFLILTYPDFK